MEGPLFPEAEEIVKDIIQDRRGFGYYPSLLKDSIKVEELGEPAQKKAEDFLLEIAAMDRRYIPDDLRPTIILAMRRFVDQEVVLYQFSNGDCEVVKSRN